MNCLLTDNKQSLQFYKTNFKPKRIMKLVSKVSKSILSQNCNLIFFSRVNN